MAKVYLVTEGEYSSYHVCAAFSTEEKAKEAAALLRDGYIEEFELDPASPHPPGLRFWDVLMNGDGTVVHARMQSVDLATQTKENACPWSERGKWSFDIWAKDEGHAIKIANERRIQMLASGDWMMTWEEWRNKRV